MLHLYELLELLTEFGTFISPPIKCPTVYANLPTGLRDIEIIGAKSLQKMTLPAKFTQTVRGFSFL
jgi:hypothetical protein